MGSPAALAAYYAAAPKPPGPNATPDEVAAYQKAKTEYQKTAGPPPPPAPVSAPSVGGGLPAARIGDLTAHGGAIILGMPTVLIGGMPASRVTDMHVCPMVDGIIPHVGGPILPPAAITVLIGELPAARVTDMCTCVGPLDTIALGCFTVFIG